VARLSWNITSQVNGQTVNDNAGNTIVGAYIYFRTGEGNQGVVFVPDNQRTEAKVKEVVHAEAQLIDGIGRLAQT
jgi:hypothetical protein